jgi:hypothetical protein
MNIHVRELTPTQRKAIERHENFRASVAAKAAELADRRTRIKLAAIPVAALEAPLAQTPEVKILDPEETPANPPSSINWFVVLSSGQDGRQYPSMLTIQKAVAAHFKVKVADLISKRRTADIILPRQIGYYLCKELTPHSLPQIGRRFGGRDHTSALHGIQKIKRLRDGDTDLDALLTTLSDQLMASL